MRGITIGAAPFVSTRPLIYGITSDRSEDVTLTYDEPSLLAEALMRGELDVALVPSIEYLRGIGRFHIEGPALVAQPGGGGVLLASQKPLAEVERIAVGEFSRTPIAALRIVLAERYNVTPDILVEKNLRQRWREQYDAVLISGDGALPGGLHDEPCAEVVNVCSLWYSVTSKPLVTALWVFNDETLRSRLTELLVSSRNAGVQNLSHLADGIAQSTQYDGSQLYDYIAQSWSYQMGPDELDGLRRLEELAMQYDVLREARLVHA